MTRSWARTFSRTVQSIVTFFLTVSTTSRAILIKVGSPSTLTELSLTSSAIVECQFVLVQLQRLFVSAAACESRTAGAAPAHQPSQAALNLSNGLPFSPRCDSQSRAPLRSLEIGRSPERKNCVNTPDRPYCA